MLVAERARRISVVSTTRADYWILRPLLKELRDRGAFDSEVVVTGSHLATGSEEIRNQVSEDNFRLGALLDIGMTSSDRMQLINSCSRLTSDFGRYLADVRPDLVVVLGDRFELLSLVQASILTDTPIAHLHGGEVTLGALDDSVRHAITKLAHLHFVAASQFADRILGLGEEPWRVHRVGSLGVDAVLAAEKLPRAEVLRQVGLRDGDFALVTIHPETRGLSSPLVLARSIVDALDALPEMGVLVTAPNSDPGGDEISTFLEDWTRARPGAAWCRTLGNLYPSALASASVVVGNSSSGIIEAPALGTPTVNVGLRQLGRPTAKSVVTTRPDQVEISAALQSALQSPARKVDPLPPYGHGETAAKIVDVLADVAWADLLRKLDVQGDRRASANSGYEHD
jgi:UDP-hydrolysing UDP-N-acetyl-D-glucosamine 2-epimerase